MPQASSELRAKWGIDDAPVIKFLKDRGYREDRFHWIPPADHEPTEEELSAIDFLMDEWDWGGLTA